ncbi:plasmid stability protein stbC [Achromobacter spanius]|uniref:FitA-like ribbon-helix-helix domain-containing protein n=1 Tax=Achromobacter spanius TaxID=217203 RepID=UPI0032092CA4
MTSLTHRNIADRVQQVIPARAARHGSSTETEIRAVQEQAVQPEDRVKLGSVLASIARKAGALSVAEVESINQVRDKAPVEPMQLD